MSSSSLLREGDPPAVEWFHAAAKRPVLLTCDHASKIVPQALGLLGLTPADLSRHIGWDIGAGEVTRRLAEKLDAPAILAGYSRLVVDCNRDPDDETSMPEASDDVVVPANRGLTSAARAQRHAELFIPYHAAIEAWLDARLAQGEVPVLLSIHSFTPAMGGAARPWHIGILWDEDPRIPVPLMAALRADPALDVGDNEPYSAKEPAGYTVRHHAEALGLPHVTVEIRQNLIDTAVGATAWAERLAAALEPILARREIYRTLR